MLRSAEIFESGSSDARCRKMSASRFVRGIGSESNDVNFCRNLSLASLDNRSRNNEGTSVEEGTESVHKLTPQREVGDSTGWCNPNFRIKGPWRHPRILHLISCEEGEFLPYSQDFTPWITPS